MTIYVDDDLSWPLLAQLLRRAGHDVLSAPDVGLSGQDDAVHLTYAVQQDRICLSGNYKDFRNLHNLILQVQGHYPGTFLVRRDNDPRRDLTSHGIVRCVRNFEASGTPIRDQFVILNHWR